MEICITIFKILFNKIYWLIFFLHFENEMVNLVFLQEKALKSENVKTDNIEKYWT